MRLWGAEEFSKLVYKAKKIYDANRKDLEKNGRMMNSWRCMSNMRL